MKQSLLRSSVAALALAGVTVASLQAPARADSAATTRTIIGAAAAIAGIATAINVEHKNQVSHHVVGYLSDGSTVYADGHVVSRNGYSWYPSNQGQQIACNGQQCSVYSNGQYGYNNTYNPGYNNTTNNPGYGNGYGYGYNNNNGGYYNNGSYNNGGYYNNQSRSRDDRGGRGNGRAGDRDDRGNGGGGN